MDGRRGGGVVVFLGIGIVHRCDKCAQINLLGVFFFELHAFQGHAVWEVCPIFGVLGRLNLGAPGGHIDFELLCSVFFRVALVLFESNNKYAGPSCGCHSSGCISRTNIGAHRLPSWCDFHLDQVESSSTGSLGNGLRESYFSCVEAFPPPPPCRGDCFHDLSVDSWLELDCCLEDVSESG